MGRPWSRPALAGGADEGGPVAAARRALGAAVGAAHAARRAADHARRTARRRAHQTQAARLCKLAAVFFYHYLGI